MNGRTQAHTLLVSTILILLLCLWWLVRTTQSVAESSRGERSAAQRTAYAGFFAGGSKQAPSTLSTLRQLVVPAEIGRIQDFVVAGGRLIAIEAPPGGRIITADLRKSEAVVFDASTSRLDLSDPFCVQYDPSDPHTAWVYDFRTGDFVSFSLAQSAREQRRVRLQAGLFQPAWVDRRVLANGLFAAVLVRSFRSNGDPEDAWGHSPFAAEAPEIAMHLNRSSMAIDPAGHRLVLASLYVSRLEIMDTSGRSQREIAGPTEIKLDYTTAPDPLEGIQRFIRTPATTYAYVDVAADEAHIYALFSGRSKGEWSQKAILADTLDLLAWSGDFLRQWRLPEAVYCIALDTVTHRLYAITPGPGAALLEFDTTAGFG